MKIKYHDNNEEIFCTHCKELIEEGEKYAEVIEDVLGEKIKKVYHLDCIPVDESDDDFFTGDTFFYENTTGDFYEAEGFEETE